MKKTIIAAGVLALLGSTAAQANGHMSHKEQPKKAAPAGVNWSGFYAGATLGGSWGEADTKLKNASTNETIGKNKVKPEAFMGGLYAGYNYELNKNIVLGVETDFLWSDKSESKTSVIDTNVTTGNTVNYKASVKQKWIGSIRARAGYALGQEKRFLPYLAAGVSYADVDNGVSVTNRDQPSRNKSHSDGDTRTGWNIGAGVDYVPPIMSDRLVLRAEYRYTDFGDETYNKADYNSDLYSNLQSMKQKIDYNQNDFRVGVAYKF